MLPITKSPIECDNSFLSGFDPHFHIANCRTGLIASATNKDELNTIIKVKGRYFMNSPIIPGHRARGINAATVVAVDDIIGHATSQHR